jgi:hypothetical protein
VVKLLRMVQVLLHVVPMYFMVNYEYAAEKFFIFLFAIVLSSWAMCYLGAALFV